MGIRNYQFQFWLKDKWWDDKFSRDYSSKLIYKRDIFSFELLPHCHHYLFFIFSFSWFGSIFLWAQWRSCRYIRRLEDVLCTFNLRPLSRGKVKKIFPKLVVKFLLHTSSISNWKTNNRKHKTLAHRHCLLEWWSLRLGFSLCHFLSPFLINSSP